MENHHAAESYHLMQREEMNFGAEMDSKDEQRFRKIFLEAILATDMANHFIELG